MIQKRQIFVNAIFSVIQILVISIIFIILYRFLLKTIGVEKLGIWSLVLATTSVTQIANMGFSGSVVKFVAKYVAREEPENVSKVIQTATISIAISIGVVLLAVYPLIKWILGLVISPESLSFALEILPFSLFALWILMIASIFNAGLDGIQRIYLRNILLMVGTLIYFSLAFILTPAYGLIGLAYAQVIQNTIILLFSWILIKRYINSLPIIPYRWDKNTFKEIIVYGVNFQVISVTILFCDPVTKALLSKFGGLSMVGYYEMANRMVLQFRSILVSINQVLVPVIANLQEILPEKIKSIYITSYQLLFYLSVPFFSLFIVSTPVISELWIGHFEKYFVIFATLLLIGRFLNTLEGPAYFANLGSGELRWNVISHMTKAILNMGFGVLLGLLFGGIGVVIAWVISLIIGSCMLCFYYHIRHKIPLRELIPSESKLLAMACLIAIFIVLAIYYKIYNVVNIFTIISIVIILYSIIVFIPIWLHPMRKRLFGWAIDTFSHRKVKA